MNPMTIRDCQLLSNPSAIQRGLFHALHPDGRRLIKGWAVRGSNTALGDGPASRFEAFIYIWFALNGWGACVADTDTDREWVDAVAGDRGISRSFDELLRDDPAFRDVAHEFAGLWPIFKSSEIRRRGIRIPQSHSRQERVRAYFESGLTGFQPSCWKRHGGQPPLDWPHTLKTLYRVRCNLFHGEKNVDSENDHVVVDAAYNVVALFVKKTELLA